MSYVPLTTVAVNAAMSITATASPGTQIVAAGVAPTTANAIDVEITDVDFNNSGPSDVTAYLQIFVSGFGLASPVYQNIGHTSDAGLFTVAGTQRGTNLNGGLVGAIRWFLPNGAAGVNLSVGGTVGFAAYTPGASGTVSVGVSYMIVWGVFSSVV